MSALIDQFRVPRLRDLWLRLNLHGVHYASRPRKFTFLYLVEDPWQMRSAREQARFGWTNELIACRFGALDTILEIGCGEGHHSQYLARQCRRLYGIDISARAVARARQRCPEAIFAIGDLLGDVPEGVPAAVDLVVACEVLYYVKDVPRFLARISQLGRACLITYYRGQAPLLEPHLARLAAAARAEFRFEGTEWVALWWYNRPTVE